MSLNDVDDYQPMFLELRELNENLVALGIIMSQGQVRYADLDAFYGDDIASPLLQVLREKSQVPSVEMVDFDPQKAKAQQQSMQNDRFFKPWREAGKLRVVEGSDDEN